MNATGRGWNRLALNLNRLFYVLLVTALLAVIACTSSSESESGDDSPTARPDDSTPAARSTLPPADADGTPTAADTPVTGDQPDAAPSGGDTTSGDTIGPGDSGTFVLPVFEQLALPTDSHEALEAIVDFGLRTQIFNYSILKALSGGYQHELLDPNVVVTPELIIAIQEALDALFVIEDRTLEAISILDLDDGLASSGFGRSGGTAAPAPKPTAGLVDAAGEFFGWISGSSERSRNRVVSISGAMTSAQRESVFQEWRQFYPEFVPQGVANSEDLFSGLESGQFDGIASRLHTQLLDVSASSVDSPAYANFAQDEGALLTQIAAEEGAEGLERGANFAVEASAAALNARFPGIDTGREYAESANEWAEYAGDVYDDPSIGVRDLVANQVQEHLLEPLGQAIDEGIRDRLGDALVDAAERATEVAGSVSEIASTLVGESDDGIARLDSDATVAISLATDEEGPTLSVTVVDEDADSSIALADGDYDVHSFDENGRVLDRSPVTIEAGWEKIVGAPGTEVPSFVLRSNTVRDELERKIETPDTVAKWVRISTEVNPDNRETEVNVAATQGRYEGTINDWEISETSFTHRDKFVNNDYFWYDQTSTFNWDAPPNEMEPGEEALLTASGTLSGPHGGGGFVGNTVEFRTDARLIYEKDDEGNNRINMGVWADGIREGLASNDYFVIIVAPGSGRPGSTFAVSAFLWNRAGAWVRWTYEYQETESPVYAAPPVTADYEAEIKRIVEESHGRLVEDEEIAEECREFSSDLFRSLCDSAEGIEQAIEGLMRARGAALEGLQPVKACTDLPTEEEALGCDLARAISSGDHEKCAVLFDGEAERFCLLGIAGTTGNPGIIEDLGDEAMQMYVASTGDLSVAGQIEDPLLHDQAVTMGMWIAASRQLAGGEDGRIPPANFCSRLRGNYAGTTGFEAAVEASDGNINNPDSEFINSQNFCSELVMSSRVISALDQVGGRDPQLECDAYVESVVYDPTFSSPADQVIEEQAIRDTARRSCESIISDADLIRAGS